MGASISAKQHERIVGFIDSAQAEGARLICGGGPPADQALARGLYIEPTVFADVTPDMRLAREEVFGPVLGILRWSDERSEEHTSEIQSLMRISYAVFCLKKKKIEKKQSNKTHNT